MVPALKELSIRGDFRTTTEYLIKVRRVGVELCVSTVAGQTALKPPCVAPNLVEIICSRLCVCVSSSLTVCVSLPRVRREHASPCSDTNGCAWRRTSALSHASIEPVPSLMLPSSQCPLSFLRRCRSCWRQSGSSSTGRRPSGWTSSLRITSVPSGPTRSLPSSAAPCTSPMLRFEMCLSVFGNVRGCSHWGLTANMTQRPVSDGLTNI